MKKIRDFKEGDRIRDVYLVKEVKNGTTAKGSPYLTVVLQDNTGMMEGKFWDVKEEDRQLIQTGRLVNFSFEVLMYNKNLQIRINKAMPADANAAVVAHTNKCFIGSLIGTSYLYHLWVVFGYIVIKQLIFSIEI